MNPLLQQTAEPIADSATNLPDWWTPGEYPPSDDATKWTVHLHDLSAPMVIVDGPAIARGGSWTSGIRPVDARRVIATVPRVLPEQLGDPCFRADHKLRYAYIAGAMANGIASESLVEAMSRAGMLGFYGAAGLPPARVERAIDRLQSSLGDRPHGFNLIHSPNEPKLEAEIAEMYVRRDVRLVEASAYLDLTLPLLRYRFHGIHVGANGRAIAPNRVIAKVSRIEVATKFFSPPPERMLAELVRARHLTAHQAELARALPVAQDITAEADSGGHTDNRPLIALLPTLMALRDRLQQRFQFVDTLRVGAAGGIATAYAVSAAFGLGAAYVVTGTINQACVESGSSDLVRRMLAQAEQADVAMAPAADMFEMGVKVQVLKRGTMFAMRAAKLFEIYRGFASLDEIPVAERTKLERDLFRAPLDEIWRLTSEFWSVRDPNQLVRASAEPKHKMALLFRWYLGLSSRWANSGEADRQADFQVWCGPSMGAFNEWARGSFLEYPENRRVAVVAHNLLHGAAVVTRLGFLRAQGVPVPAELNHVAPNMDIDSP